MSSPRTGSAIIYCLGLSAIVVVIGYGFLRSTMRDSVAGSGSQHALLAQAAARAGVAAASEAILADYASASLVVGSGNASSVTVAVPGHPAPPTFLDGPFRAPFISLTSPDRVQDVDNNSLDGMNDVRAENTVINPMTRLMDNDNLGRTQGRYEWFNAGIVLYDGRGRFIEPNYHNVTRPTPAAASPVAVATTKVLDLAATPERHNALFLDSAMRRVTSDGTPAGDLAARAAARYRLRYAVGVVDLGGHLLSTPSADLNADWQDAGNDYRTPPLWVQDAAEAWYNMVVNFPIYRQQTSHHTQALRWQHVFQGRGNASNYDRAPGTSFPVTFPSMFRIWTDAPIAGKHYYWGLYSSLLQEYVGNSETTGLLKIPGITATQAGGEALKATYIWDYFTHTSTGPQPSWYTQHQSVRGMLGNTDSYSNIPRRDGAYYWAEQAPMFETAQFLPTPFGRGVSAYPYGSFPGRHVQNHPPDPAPPRTWYESGCNSPWYVNVLTAPPRVINCMLMAYLPPSLKAGEREENFALKVDPASIPPRTKTDVPANSEWLGPWQLISSSRVMRGHDLFTRLAGPGFSEWPTPASGGTDPNFLAPDLRTPAQTYPGVLWNTLGYDDLGRRINSDSVLGTGLCSHSNISFTSVSVAAGSETVYLKGGATLPATTPPAGWGADPDDRFVQRSSVAYSYWYDISRAFTSAIAITRAAWVQYPNACITPSSAFSPTTLRNPTSYDTIEELDRLFLRQLGEDFDNPGNGTPLKPILLAVVANKQIFTESGVAISHTIRTLRTGDLIAAGGYTSDDRAAIMERVLNDFRMSFFGASPQYCDRFRPFDFDNDGKVMCSAYAASGVPGELAKGIDRYSTIEPTAVTWGNRRGLAPVNWFSIAGTFFIGKSHHYRIFCRGELFDNVVQRPVADATLESVLVVDPEGTDITQSHYLFQRWHHNRYTGHMSLLER